MGYHQTANHSNEKSVKEKIEKQINKLFGNLTRFVASVYVLFYLCIFPLCLHDKYYDVLDFRFELFWKPTAVVGILFVVIAIMYGLSDSLYNKGNIIRNTIDDIKKRKYHLTRIDILMTGILLVFSISTIFSEYPYEAFWGDRGRRQGLFLWLIFYVAYWIVTRFYKFCRWHLWAYVIFAGVVCGWGICNFFLITFDMFKDTEEIYKYMFVSSIGNINTYTNFTGIYYGVCVALFIRCETKSEGILSIIALLIASFAQIMGMSDNVILSTGIVLALAPLLLCEKDIHIAKYFTCVSAYLLAIKITSLAIGMGIHTMNDNDPSIQITLGGKTEFAWIIALFVFISVAYSVKAYYAKKKIKLDYEISRVKSAAHEKSNLKVFKYIWAGLLVFFILSVVIIFVLANIGWKEEIWDPYSKFLVFNDSWGTGRGLIWRLGMDYWHNDADLFKKLFGYGPDTFYIITMDRYLDIMEEAGYGMFDNAHNEYFEYFITVGIIGLISYVSFLLASIIKMFKSENVYSKIIGIGIIAYAAQAVVNIAIPITTPVFMILLFVGVAICKDEVITLKR